MRATAYNNFKSRVAKCHGYGGYISVKNLECWGKKSGRTHSFAKSSIVLGKFEQLTGLYDTTRIYDRMFSLCPPEVAFCVIAPKASAEGACI